MKKCCLNITVCEHEIVMSGRYREDSRKFHRRDQLKRGEIVPKRRQTLGRDRKIKDCLLATKKLMACIILQNGGGGGGGQKLPQILLHHVHVATTKNGARCLHDVDVAANANSATAWMKESPFYLVLKLMRAPDAHHSARVRAAALFYAYVYAFTQKGSHCNVYD